MSNSNTILLLLHTDGLRNCSKRKFLINGKHEVGEISEIVGRDWGISMKAFNVETRTLDYTDKNENHYLLQLRGKINIVKKASGTGKTYLVQALKSEKKSEIEQEK